MTLYWQNLTSIPPCKLWESSAPSKKQMRQNFNQKADISTCFVARIRSRFGNGRERKPIVDFGVKIRGITANREHTHSRNRAPGNNFITRIERVGARSQLRKRFMKAMWFNMVSFPALHQSDVHGQNQRRKGNDMFHCFPFKIPE